MTRRSTATATNAETQLRSLFMIFFGELASQIGTLIVDGAQGQCVLNAELPLLGAYD
jgi:hypothetical protein